MVRGREDPVVEQQHDPADDDADPEEGHHHALGPDASGLHGRDLVVGGELAERVQHGHEDRHGQRQGHRMREGEVQELQDDVPGQALAGQVLQPLGHGVQEEEARERGEGEDERPHVGPNQI